MRLDQHGGGRFRASAAQITSKLYRPNPHRQSLTPTRVRENRILLMTLHTSRPAWTEILSVQFSDAVWESLRSPLMRRGRLSPGFLTPRHRTRIQPSHGNQPYLIFLRHLGQAVLILLARVSRLVHPSLQLMTMAISRHQDPVLWRQHLMALTKPGSTNSIPYPCERLLDPSPRPPLRPKHPGPCLTRSLKKRVWTYLPNTISRIESSAILCCRA